MIQGPVRGSVGDADSVVELGNECFTNDRDAGGVLPRWPHALYQVTNRFVMKDGARVVSHVGYADQTAIVEGNEIKAAGITFVSTSPDYRNRGFMTQLLKRCIEAMTEEGYAFSDLGGNRQRYGHFGWENAGREWNFHITKRSLDDSSFFSKSLSKKPEVINSNMLEGFQVTPYQGSSEEIDAIIAIHEQEPLRMKRTRELYEMLLGRMGRPVWLASYDNDRVSYVITDDSEKYPNIVEFGGNEDGIHTILRYFIDHKPVESIGVSSPWIHPLNHKFFSISSSWDVRCFRMFKILNLELTLRGFTNQLVRKYNEFGFQDRQAVSIGIENTDQIVEIEFNPDNVYVSKTSLSPSTLILPERDMVKLIFGPGTPYTIVKLPNGLRFLDTLLPLDFYLWGNETV